MIEYRNKPTGDWMRFAAAPKHLAREMAESLLDDMRMSEGNRNAQVRVDGKTIQRPMKSSKKAWKEAGCMQPPIEQYKVQTSEGLFDAVGTPVPNPKGGEVLFAVRDAENQYVVDHIPTGLKVMKTTCWPTAFKGAQECYLRARGGLDSEEAITAGGALPRGWENYLNHIMRWGFRPYPEWKANPDQTQETMDMAKKKKKAAKKKATAKTTKKTKGKKAKGKKKAKGERGEGDPQVAFACVLIVGAVKAKMTDAKIHAKLMSKFPDLRETVWDKVSYVNSIRWLINQGRKARYVAKPSKPFVKYDDGSKAKAKAKPTKKKKKVAKKKAKRSAKVKKTKK